MQRYMFVDPDSQKNFWGSVDQRLEDIRTESVSNLDFTTE